MALNAGAQPGAAPGPEERRARQDRLSRAMGELLLRGYRMLGRCCPHCGTILLQDKQQQLLCVGCQEPESGGGGGTAPDAPPAAAPRPERCEGAAAGIRGAPCAPPGEEAAAGVRGVPPGEEAAVAAARAAVLEKLGWAARELPRAPAPEPSAQLCALVRACAEALGALRALGPPAPPPP